MPTFTAKNPSTSMKTLLLAVGRTADRHIAALTTDYLSRLKHYIPVEAVTVESPRNARGMDPAEAKRHEEAVLRRQLAPGDYVVLLDERGAELTSRELAAWMQRRMNTAPRRLVFIIGGAYGFSEGMYALAQEKLSLSRLTFNHQMERPFLVEQLYRAMTILRGEPYHNE